MAPAPIPRLRQRCRGTVLHYLVLRPCTASGQAAVHSANVMMTASLGWLTASHRQCIIGDMLPGKFHPGRGNNGKA